MRVDAERRSGGGTQQVRAADQLLHMIQIRHGRQPAETDVEEIDEAGDTRHAGLAESFRCALCPSTQEVLMKRAILALAIALTAAVATAAYAERPTKVDIAHCGCAEDGSDLVWVFLNISSKSKGHQQHDAGDVEECLDTDGFVAGTFERGADDCVLFGGDPLNGVATCVADPVEGDSCSADTMPL